MRILVMNGFLAKQHSQLRQIFQDRNICIKNKHSLKTFPGSGRKASLLINRAFRRKLVFNSCQIVNVAMSRSSMDTSCTAFKINIIGKTQQNFTVDKFRHRMMRRRKLQLRSLNCL